METDSKLILSQAQQFYHIKPLREITTGSSGNNIYEVMSEQTPYILRVSQYSQSEIAHIEFELNWIEYLSARMEGIIKPVRSLKHNLYEVAEAGGKSYVLCLQEKARGRIIDINNPEEFNETLFYRLGALMGRMHRLTAEYEGNRVRPEFEWNGPHFWRRNIEILDEDVRQSERQFLAELALLPVDRANYGIVHFDIHTDNFLVDNDKITLIDFYECQFNWYAADMASALFFMVQKGANPLKNVKEKQRTEFAETYLISYLKGYLQTNTISKYWIHTFDLFMKYQMLDEYIFAQNYWPEEFGDRRQWYMEWHKEKIIHNRPYVNINYEKVIGSVTASQPAGQAQFRP